METKIDSRTITLLNTSRKTRSGFRRFHFLLYTVWILIAGYLLASGWSYYNLPLQERPFSPEYDTYKPGGIMGLNLGIWGTLSMALGVLTYSVRKRVRQFKKVGKLRYWLSFHIFLCSLGAFLVLLHTSFKVNGIVAISFISMVIVVISGLIGRYLYVHVPRTLNGQVRNLEALKDEKKVLLDGLQGSTGISREALETLFPSTQHEEIRGIGKALQAAFYHDFNIRKRKKWILEQAKQFGIAPHIQKTFVDVMREQVRLERQIALLTPFKQLFRYWITIHVPLTIIMGVIVLVHIGVAFAFGYIITF